MIPAGKLGVLAGLCFLLSGCAQTGPPLPPSLELPRAPSDLRASRKGDHVVLTWTGATLTTDRQTVRYLGPTRICRALTSDMKECGDAIAQVAPPPRSANPPGGAPPKPQSYTDTLPAPLQGQNPMADITYAVEVPNRDGRSAGLSNRVQVSAAPTLPPPRDFKTQLTRDGVVLTWQTTAEFQVAPSISHRYRVYRREVDGGKDVLVGELPLHEAGAARILDQNIEWEKSYLYHADVLTAVNLGMRPCPITTVTGADCVETREVEGDDTPEVQVIAHDVFPPAVPAGLQAVYSGEGQQPFVDLIWAPVTDADLAGYNVYRRDGDGAPVKVNSALVASPAYRDSAVTAGKNYVYSVSAVDVRGNESSRSEEASESVP